ncbi:MAG: GntR family transcriptional regulator [Bacteroidetes bacterium]|jgi:GntR family transcriptional regulator|nr:GntR family transcriptional regulator [Bacteroidota bacterium]MBT5530769.1 GntR family transcriptional regulator [Cytophagia bacterium]MBT3802777.1 GntR family transcriptional regulator [Bacteroidota bacterium]MBT3934635.1 GntR family transcriptional regulator [Bacteroidota bacterium]MBT4729041.1 GntR family transcriptional regulator [Bacteroidota bacterium]
MEFREKQAIYMQIADEFAVNILNNKWKADEKVPSIRQLAIDLEVNPNTVMRTYSYLQESNIIYNKRGIGYFVGEDAQKIILDMMKKRFKDNELPELFKKMTLLKIEVKELESYFEEWKKNRNN